MTWGLHMASPLPLGRRVHWSESSPSPLWRRVQWDDASPSPLGRRVLVACTPSTWWCLSSYEEYHLVGFKGIQSFPPGSHVSHRQTPLKTSLSFPPYRCSCAVFLTNTSVPTGSSFGRCLRWYVSICFCCAMWIFFFHFCINLAVFFQ